MKKILFICGSLNQTTQMHQIARQLMDEAECFFTPYYADGIENLAARMGWLDSTVLGGRHRRETDSYLAQHNLKVDLRGESNEYDLVVTCSDLIVQKNIRKKRIVLVQEGITEPEGLAYKLVRWLKLPRYLANTATNGQSNAYELFCVASPTSITWNRIVRMISPTTDMFW
jgi:galactitol-specific phosphotransferase system IIB component